MATAELFALGNELLLGDVQDTNTHYLCRHLTGLGGQVTRVLMLPDEKDVIAAEVRAALHRRPDLILTTGGLGPTDDDLTLTAVAAAVGVPLELHTEALAQVTAKYEDLAARGQIASADMTASRRKMALLPRGAVPVRNPVGAAPGVEIRVGPTILVCLPGVPAELVGIVEQSLPPLWTELFGHAVYIHRSLWVDSNDESALAHVLRRVAAAHPALYLKSRARRFGGEVRMNVTVSGRGHDRHHLEREISEAIHALDRALHLVRVEESG